MLAECLKPGVQDVVLDGEMMVWNNETGDYAAFGENRGLGDHMRRIENHTQPCYVVFDILWLDGENLAPLSMRERRAKLENVANWKVHSMELSVQHLVEPNPSGMPPSKTHTEEVMNWLDRALQCGSEGVMFKSLASTYTPGSRDHDWMKLKPDYVHDMGDNPELLILAGYYGEGERRKGGVSHFLLGLRAPPSEKHRHPNAKYPLFYPFCKVGTGYSVERLHQLRGELAAGRRLWDKRSRPDHLCGWVPSKPDDEPDEWYVPQQSVLMAVAAYEMVKADTWRPAGLTLRFPRSAGLRSDKIWTECASFEEMEQLFKDGKAKIAASKRTAAEVAQGGDDLKYGGEAGRRNKKAKAERTTRPVKVLEHIRIDLAQLAATAVVSDALKGEVCLIRGYGGKLGDPRHLQSLRKLVVAHGGEAHGSQSELVTLIIDADEVSGEAVRACVEDAMQQEVSSYDIVRASWLLDIHLAEKRLPLEPRYLLYAKPETREQMATTMDRWGDRFTEEATVESLTQAAALVRKQTLDERRDVAQLTASSAASSAAPSTALSVGASSATVPPRAGAWPIAKHPPVQSSANAAEAAAADPPAMASAMAAVGTTSASVPVAMRNAREGRGATLQMLALDEQLIAGDLEKLPDDDLAALTRGGTSMLLFKVVAYSPRAAVRLRLRLAGATVVSHPTSGTTHAVLPAPSVADGTCASVRHELSRLRQIAAPSTGPGLTAHVLSEAWLDECEAQGSRADENGFTLREGRA